MASPIRALALLLVAAGGSAACAGEVDAESEVGDVGATAEALSASSCRLSRATLLARAVGARRTAIERGFRWYDAHVEYSQAASFQGYRTDCSGFVSMCWQLDRSYGTVDFSSGGGRSDPLSGYATLRPADALVRRSAGSGHIMLFLGWTDESQSAACVLEQASRELDMQFVAYSKSSLVASGFKPIRADKLASVSESDPDDGAAAGKACSNTGSCNPGNEGSGLICVDGRCKPGCITDAQCPASRSCKSGKCQ